MKRKHIYVGGTVLLALLGALGGYFLFAGSDSDPGRRNAENSEQGTDPDETLPIEVLPVADDAFENVPPIEDGSPRYAMGGSQLDEPTGYATPAPGGASPLPVDVDANDRPDPSGLPTGEPANPPDAYSNEPYDLGDGAARSAREAFDASGNEDELITRGQEPSLIEAAQADLANPLRGSARAAFDAGEDGPDTAPPINGGRYGDAGEPQASPELAEADPTAPAIPAGPSDEDALTAALSHSPQDLLPPDDIPDATQQDVSAPAPMMIADASAVPLPSSLPTPAERRSEEFAVNDSGQRGYAHTEGGVDEGDNQNDIDGGFGYPSAGSAGGDPLGDASVNAYATPAGPGAGGSPPQDFSVYGAASDLGTAAAVPGVPAGGSPAAVGGEGTGRPGEAALEGLQSPQLAIEKNAPSEIQVGKKCTFSVVVRNVGGISARDVRLVDEIPLGTQLVGTSPRATVLGSRLEWELGTLAPGDEYKVEIDLMPVNEGEIGSVATVQFAAAATARAHCTRPVLELVSDMTPSVLIGEQQVVRITLRNPGSGDATGVMLLENVPEGMSHPHGRDLEFEVGTLHAGESRELELVLTAERKGIVQNRIVAKGDGNLYTEDIAEFEVVAPAISVSVDGPARKYLELPATFTVAIENPGTAAASDIELVGKLPEGLEFVSADKYGQYDEATRSVFWSLAELPPRERGEVKLVAMPVQLGEQRIEIKADAKLGLADRAERTMQVEGLAAIKSEVSDIADPVEVGTETSYEIRVVNQGSKAATNVQVVAQFPEGVGAIRADGPTPNPRVEPGRVTFAPLEKLSPKADATYRIDARGISPGDQRVLVLIMTDDLSAPIKQEESTRVYADR